MSRRSSRLSWPVVLIGLAVIGCRQWQQSQTPPKPTTKTTKRPPRSDGSSPVSSSGLRSNEGFLLLGNPSNAGKAADNFLLEHPQYALSYNRARGGPNWVSWHTDASDLGQIERGKFRPDPELPASWRITPTDYKGSGFDRGHVCPSGDRTASREANDATFYMSNMLPQTAALNQHVWADLENYLRDQIRAGNEIYQVAGGAGSAGSIAGGEVTVPQVCWKVAVILPEGDGDLRRIGPRTRVLAVGMPNVEDSRLQNGDWRSYLTTTDKIEAATSLDLLSALPDAVEKALEQKKDAGS
jgi:endonuclease G